MIRRFRRILRIFPKLLLLLLILFSLVGCKERVMLDVKTPAMDRNLPDETSYGVTITEMDGTAIGYVLQAQKIERYYDRKMLYGWKVKISTYDKLGKLKSTINADTTVVDDARNIIIANGKVLMKSDNASIETRKIVWDRNLDEITAPDKVTLTRDGSVLKGTKLRTNSMISFAEMDAVEAEGIFEEKDLDW